MERNPHKSKAVVWAHSSHLGDARHTSMGWRNGELNVGQLCHQTFSKSVGILRCGTQTGTVAAAHNWDDDMQVMKVNPSHPDSYEYLMHETGIDNFLLDLRKGKCYDELREALMQKRLERFNGIVYRPDTER
jgi:erythromycin esterase-like protein